MIPVTYNVKCKTLLLFSLTWFLPLIVLSIISLSILDLKMRNIYFILLAIVIVPSFFLFVLYFIRDINKKIIVGADYIEKKGCGHKEILYFNEIKEVIRVSSYFEDSLGYGSLFFLGGAFYYYQVKDLTGTRIIEASCLLLNEWGLNNYQIIEKKVFIPI